MFFNHYIQKRCHDLLTSIEKILLLGVCPLKQKLHYCHICFKSTVVFSVICCFFIHKSRLHDTVTKDMIRSGPKLIGPTSSDGPSAKGGVMAYANLHILSKLLV